jgi:hypothetical protein
MPPYGYGMNVMAPQPSMYRQPFPAQQYPQQQYGYSSRSRLQQSSRGPHQGLRRSPRTHQQQQYGGSSHYESRQVVPAHRTAAQQAASVQPDVQVTQQAVPAVVEQQVDRQTIGEHIYSRLTTRFANDEARWGKITGMILESIPHEELLVLYHNSDALDAKITEANNFYEEHTQGAQDPEGGVASSAQE